MSDFETNMDSSTGVPTPCSVIVFLPCVEKAVMLTGLQTSIHECPSHEEQTPTIVLVISIPDFMKGGRRVTEELQVKLRRDMPFAELNERLRQRYSDHYMSSHALSLSPTSVKIGIFMDSTIAIFDSDTPASVSPTRSCSCLHTNLLMFSAKDWIEDWCKTGARLVFAQRSGAELLDLSGV